MQRLRNKMNETGMPHEYLLVHYAIERFLYRLSLSDYRDKFVLKGGVASLTFDIPALRATRDIDFLSYIPRTPGELRDIVAAIWAVDNNDGLWVDPASFTVQETKAQTEPGGLRLKCVARLDTAEIPMQMDFGFGDAVSPPRLWVYRPEAIIAEKIHAVISLGMANSRLKDFYDVWFITETQNMNGDALGKALDSTFSGRGKGLPPAVTDEFVVAYVATHDDLWRAYARRASLGDPFPPLLDALRRIQVLLAPLLEALAAGKPLAKTWAPAQGWVDL